MNMIKNSIFFMLIIGLVGGGGSFYLYGQKEIIKKKISRSQLTNDIAELQLVVTELVLSVQEAVNKFAREIFTHGKETIGQEKKSFLVSALMQNLEAYHEELVAARKTLDLVLVKLLAHEQELKKLHAKNCASVKKDA